MQLERTVEIAGPDKELAVLIGNLDGVIDHDPVVDPNADLFDLDIGEGIELDVFNTPFLPRIPRQGDNVVDGRRRNHRTGVVDDFPSACQPPRSIRVLNAIIVDDRPVLDDPHQVGRVFAELHLGAPRRPRPGLFHLPRLVRVGGHGQQVFHGRAGNRVAAGIRDGRSAVEHPEPTDVIFNVDAVVGQRHRPVGSGFKQDGRQFPTCFKGLTPVAEDRANLSLQQEVVRRGHRARHVGDDLTEGHVVGHRDAEVRHRAIAGAVDLEVLLPRRKTRFPREPRKRLDAVEDRLEHVADAAIGHQDLARGQQLRTLRRGCPQFGIVQVDGHDPELVKRAQFAGVGFSVRVGVLPDQKLLPYQVRRRDLSVGIAAVFDQVVLRQLGVSPFEPVAEHLADIVNTAVVVFINDKEAVVPLHPPGDLCKEVLIDVEIDLVPDCPEGFNAVAVQIDDERVRAGDPCGGFRGTDRRTGHPVRPICKSKSLQCLQQTADHRG